MEEKIKQAIENIAKNLEVHKEYIRFDNTEQIYIIEDYLDNKIIEIKKDIKFDNLMDYPLKFSYCNFLETVIGWNKTFKEKIIFKEVVFCKVVNFSFSIFDKNINFSNVKFEDKLYFEKCQFKEKFEFFGINNLKVEFNNSLFEKEVYFGKEINDKNIEKSNSFGSCSFEYANFSNCYFKNEVYFKNNEFKQVFFRNSKFNDNVYFNNSVFKDYTDFHECEFEKTACFYGVRFDKAPNFSACYFKEPKAVNLINVDIDKLDFKSLEQYIEDNYKDETCENKQEITEEQRNNNCKLKCAKHLKDSFRVIKDVLITQNNTLEAQEWHKLELYAKEKELEIQLSKNKNDNLKKESKNQVYNPKDYEKFNYSRLKTLKSKLMPLIFYSLLPMAHTLFLPFYLFCTIFIIIKIITKILIKISKLFYYFYISFRPLEWNKFIIFWKVKFNHCIKKLMTFGRKMLDFTLWFDCILLQVYRNTSDHHTNFLKILNFTILMISLYAFMGFLFSKTVDFISYFDQISIAIASYIILLVFALMLVNVKKQLYQYGVILIFMLCGAFTISMILFLSSEYISTFCFLIYFLGVLIFYLFFICKIKLFVFIVRFFAYMIFIATIIIKPQLINPFAGIFSSDKLYESKFEKRLNDLNTSAIINLAKLSQKDFNFTKEYINISFTELNSAKTLIIA
ncbi:pentapeptide repeat-containing protein, partial [Campylobacter jejuni]|nr:pentapeptide repeat-containing protein [Campylobacter jejuni]